MDVIVATYLDRIIEHHRARAAADDRSLEQMVDRARSIESIRPFRSLLAGTDELAVIAEIKRRSPSKGDLNLGLDPAEMAGRYQRGGATCLSVLTDVAHFGGSVADLQAARSNCSLPVLRKDFTVSELDVVDTRLMGADCVLLIAAALSPSELRAFHDLAVDIGLDVLVEVHDEAELATALEVGADLIGVNQRDLVTFEVDNDRAVRMAASMPPMAVKVAESGVRGPTDARSLRSAGYDAVLVGESIVTSSDPASMIASLRAG